MRQMTAKEYLEQVKKKDARINNLIREKENLHAKLYSIGAIQYDKDKVQSSPNPDRLGVLYGEIDLKEREITKKIDELIDFRLKVTDEINELSDERYITVLYRRYIEFQTWEKIAIEMGYNTRYVQQLNGNALLQFYDLHGETLKLIKKKSA